MARWVVVWLRNTKCDERKCATCDVCEQLDVRRLIAFCDMLCKNNVVFFLSQSYALLVKIVR